MYKITIKDTAVVAPHEYVNWFLLLAAGAIGPLVAIIMHWRQKPRPEVTALEIVWSAVALVLGAAMGMFFFGVDHPQYAPIASWVVAMGIENGEYGRQLLLDIVKKNG